MDARGLRFTLALAPALAGVQLAERMVPEWVVAMGCIVPRTLPGLGGILTAPLLHATWAHLLVNLGPLLVLCALLFLSSAYRPWPTLAQLWLLSGLGTWLIGRPGSAHLGASGLIFALLMFLVVAGARIGRWTALLTAGAVLAFYGTTFLGAVPWLVPAGVSWEAHLSGALAGLLVALRLPLPKPDPVEAAARAALAEADRLEKLSVHLLDGHRDRRP